MLSNERRRWCFHYTRWQYLWYSQQKSKYPLCILSANYREFFHSSFPRKNKKIHDQLELANALPNFDRRPHVKSGVNWSSGFRELSGDNILIVTKNFTTLIIHCKFQPLVFNTFWENDFSMFPHTNAYGCKFDLFFTIYGHGTHLN